MAAKPDRNAGALGQAEAVSPLCRRGRVRMLDPQTEPSIRLSKELTVVWIIVLFGFSIFIRLINITQPFVDSWSWKQSTIAMIARNFYLHGYAMMYPQIDWSGPFPGYIGSEFPLVPFTASLLYPLFGVNESIGRLLSVTSFGVSVPFFFLLSRPAIGERSSLIATVIYSIVPLSIFSSRSFMSDMTALCLSIIAVYIYSQWIYRTHSNVLFISAAAAIALAILTKLPSIIIGVPLLYISYEAHGWSFLRERRVWLLGISSLVLPVCWYAHANAVSTEHYPYHFTGQDGIRIMDIAWYRNILSSTIYRGLTPIVAIAMFGGLLLPNARVLGRLFHWWLLVVIAFIIIVGYGNRHPWYQLPMLPAAAALAGLGLNAVWERIQSVTGSRTPATSVIVAVFIAIGYLSYASVAPLYRPWAEPLYEAGQAIDRITAPAALVIMADDGDSSMLYYARRKGWHFLPPWGDAPRDSYEAIAHLELLSDAGGSYLVFTRYTVWWLQYYSEFTLHLESNYECLYRTEDYMIIGLDGRRSGSESGSDC